jgi:hypothetical protein
MFRLCNCLLIALVASTATSLEPHLRFQTTEQNNEDNEESCMQTKFSLEKHIDCEGGCSKRKGMERSCNGDMKKEFSEGVSVSDIATDMGQNFPMNSPESSPLTRKRFCHPILAQSKVSMILWRIWSRMDYPRPWNSVVLSRQTGSALSCILSLTANSQRRWTATSPAPMTPG